MRYVPAKIVLTGQFDWCQLGNYLQPCNMSAFQVEKLKLFLSFYLCRIPENCPGDCHWFCYHGIHWLFRQTHSYSHQQHHSAIAHVYGKWQFLARIIAGLKRTLLHLPTQMRFLIGGERVTCRGLNPSNSLGRIKLTNSLGKQQLELWTRTWSGCAPLKL